MPKKLVAAAMFWVSLVTAVPATADVLGTWPYGGGYGSADQWQHRIQVWVVFSGSNHYLFDGVWLDMTHVGTTLTATAETDPDFDSVVDQLTNGVWEWICMGETVPTGQGGGWCRPEYEAFDLGVVDFYEATIDSITLTLDDLQFDDDGGTSVSYSATVTVYGSWSVPVRRVTWGHIKTLYRRTDRGVERGDCHRTQANEDRSPLRSRVGIVGAR